MRLSFIHVDNIVGFIDLGAANETEREDLISFDKSSNVRPRRGGDGKLTLGMQDRRRKVRTYTFIIIELFIIIIIIMNYYELLYIYIYVFV